MTAPAPTRLRRSDRDRVMITPEGIALPITVASKGARAGALILDLIVVTLLQVAVTIGLFLLLFGSLSALPNFGDPGAIFGPVELILVLWIIAMFLFRYAYFLYFELGPRGATPGKRMAGIRIAARDGDRLSADMVIARNLLRDIELFLPVALLFSVGDDNAGPVSFTAAAWFLIFAFFPFFNKDRLRAGDIIAGSWVVERPRRKLETAMSVNDAAQPGATQRAGAYRFSDEELAVYGEYELQTLERVLRERRKDAIAAVHEAICRKIGRNDGAGDEQAFLEAYYRQLRARLEANMRMGRRKADKHA